MNCVSILAILSLKHIARALMKEHVGLFLVGEEGTPVYRSEYYSYKLVSARCTKHTPPDSNLFCFRD